MEIRQLPLTIKTESARLLLQGLSRKIAWSAIVRDVNFFLVITIAVVFSLPAPCLPERRTRFTAGLFLQKASVRVPVSS